MDKPLRTIEFKTKKQILETNTTGISSLWFTLSHIYEESGEKLPNYVRRLACSTEKGVIDHNLKAQLISTFFKEDIEKLSLVFDENLKYIAYCDPSSKLWDKPDTLHEDIYVRGGFCIIDGKTMRQVTNTSGGWNAKKILLKKQLEAAPSAIHVLETVLPTKTIHGTPTHVISLEDSLFSQYVARMKSGKNSISIAESMELLLNEESEILDLFKSSSLRLIVGVEKRYMQLYKQEPNRNKIKGVFWSKTLPPKQSLQVLANSPLVEDLDISMKIKALELDSKSKDNWISLWITLIDVYTKRYLMYKDNKATTARDLVLETLRALFLTHWPAVFSSSHLLGDGLQENWPIVDKQLMLKKYNDINNHLLLRVHDDIAIQSVKWVINNLHQNLKSAGVESWNFDPCFQKIHVDTTYGNPDLGNMFSRWINRKATNKQVLISKPADHVVIHHSYFAKGVPIFTKSYAQSLVLEYKKRALPLITSIQPLSNNGDFAADDMSTLEDFNRYQSNPDWIKSSYLNPSPLSRNGLVLYATNFAIHNSYIKSILKLIVDLDKARLSNKHSGSGISFSSINITKPDLLKKELTNFLNDLKNELITSPGESNYVLQKAKRYFGSLIQVSISLQEKELYNELERCIHSTTMTDGHLHNIMSDKNSIKQWVQLINAFINKLEDSNFTSDQQLGIISKLFISKVSGYEKPITREDKLLLDTRIKILKNLSNQIFAKDVHPLLKELEISLKKEVLDLVK